jgi:hypothetical protein
LAFKSLKQLAKFNQLQKEGKISQAKIDEWKAATPSFDKLPEHAPKKPTGTIRGPRKSRRPR